MLGFRNSKVTKIVIIIFAVCLDMALGTDLDCVINTLNNIIQCLSTVVLPNVEETTGFETNPRHITTKGRKCQF